MVLGQIECEGPYLSISSCSDVRFCDERLVTVSVEVNGRTTFRVNLLSFFSWVVITRFTAFWTLYLTVRWKTYLSMLLIIPLICTANLSLSSVNLQSSFLRLAIALFKRRFRIACTSCLLVFGSWKQINFGNTLNDKQFLRKFKSEIIFSCSNQLFIIIIIARMKVHHEERGTHLAVERTDSKKSKLF